MKELQELKKAHYTLAKRYNEAITMLCKVNKDLRDESLECWLDDHNSAAYNVALYVSGFDEDDKPEWAVEVNKKGKAKENLPI